MQSTDVSDGLIFGVTEPCKAMLTKQSPHVSMSKLAADGTMSGDQMERGIVRLIWSLKLT